MATNSTHQLLTRTLFQVVVVAFIVLANTIHAFVPGSRRHETFTQRVIVRQSTSASSAPPPPPQSLHPPLSKREIEELLDYIPVYTITDPTGQLIYIEPADEQNHKTFNFYISSQMARMALQELKTQTDSTTSNIDSDDLKLSAFSLGKVWFDHLNKKEDGTTSNDERVYNLVASEQDLLGARMLLTMGSEDEEELMKASSPQEQRRILDRINEEAPKFKLKSLNEIPVFMIAQMRIQVEKKPMIPMYLCNEDMISTYQNFLSNNNNKDGETATSEPSIQLLELHEIVELMQQPCAFDFRSVMIMPPKEEEEEEAATAKKTFGQGLSF